MVAVRNTSVHRLADTIQANKENVIALWREKVRVVPAARRLDRPALDHRIAAILDELAEALRQKKDEPMIKMNHLRPGAAEHAIERLHQDFNLTEVVAEYNALREVIHGFAEANQIRMAGPVNATVNRVLDNAVATAVQTFSETKEFEIQRQREEHLSFVVHDLKAPLSALAIAAKILDKSLPVAAKDEHICRMFEILHRNVFRLTALITKVLQETVDIQSGGSGVRFPAKLERREFDLWRLVQELMDDLQPLSEMRGTQLKNEIPAGCVVYADPKLLTQVFQNLISNAIDYTQNGEIVISASSTKQMVQCCVQDTGEGIPEDRIDKIFDKLETAGRKKGGFGLGLTVAKQIVEAHGGHIEVASKLGSGSTFNIYLPANMS